MLRSAAARACSKDGTHDQASDRHPSKERYGHGRERLILDPAPKRPHALVGSAGYLLHDPAGHLPGNDSPLPQPSRQQGDATANLVQALPQLGDFVLGVGLAPGGDIAFCVGIVAFVVALGRCCSPR